MKKIKCKDSKIIVDIYLINIDDLVDEHSEKYIKKRIKELKEMKRGLEDEFQAIKKLYTNKNGLPKSNIPYPPKVNRI